MGRGRHTSSHGRDHTPSGTPDGDPLVPELPDEVDWSAAYRPVEPTPDGSPRRSSAWDAELPSWPSAWDDSPAAPPERPEVLSDHGPATGPLDAAPGARVPAWVHGAQTQGAALDRPAGPGLGGWADGGGLPGAGAAAGREGGSAGPVPGVGDTGAWPAPGLEDTGTFAGIEGPGAGPASASDGPEPGAGADGSEIRFGAGADGPEIRFGAGVEGPEIRLGGLSAEPTGGDGSGDSGEGRRGRSRRSRRRPKVWQGRRLVALCAVAVVAAVSVVVIAVRLGSGPLNLTEAPDCGPDEVCAAVATGEPNNGLALPGTADADPLATEAPVDEPSATPSKKAKTGDGRPSARPTASAVPSPRPSRTGERSRPTGRPTPERTTAEPVPDPTRDAPDPSPENTEISPPDDDLTPDQNEPLTTVGTVSVGFGVSDVTRTGYTGRVTITNTGEALNGWELRLPVGGAVTAADTPGWFQDGDTLVLTSSASLGRDETLVVTFTADGEPSEPGSCELTDGDCRLRGDG
ncbi:hypothetical protein ABGB17_06200 [Sphaerisporangium sp. B11E5]|uniref:hypothetical protein n=1 Tax=Sphaerisporangium sp. B11E5 TaxID=3153563 RepID=UPI00325E4494